MRGAGLGVGVLECESETNPIIPASTPNRNQWENVGIPMDPESVETLGGLGVPSYTESVKFGPRSYASPP